MNKRRPATKFKLARVAAGWRIGDLAQAAGLAVCTVRELETGKTAEPREKTRRALAQVLGIAESKLFGPGR